MKKYTQKFLFFITLFTASLLFMGLSAEALTYGDYEYIILDDSTVEITKYNGNDADIVIPAEINEKDVTAIGEEAFYGNENLRNVTIADTVTIIKNSAFACCYFLKSVTIPSSITDIEGDAFFECDTLYNVYASSVDSWFKINFSNETSNPMFSGKTLYFNDEPATEITIPDDVTIIKEGILRNCKTIKKINLHNNITKIESYAFYECDALESIVIPEKVTSIGESAFEACDTIETVTIGESVTTIYGSAFYRCPNLNSVTIGKNVTDIYPYAFSNCPKLSKVYAANLESWLKIKSPSNPGYINFIPTENGADLYFDGIPATEITIPDSITDINLFAFYGCTSITKVTIPDHVTKIGYAAFKNCSNLTDVVLSNNITFIEQSAFNSCNKLTNLKLGNNIETISYSAFDNCPNLTDVTFPASLKYIIGQNFTHIKKATFFNYEANFYDYVYDIFKKADTIYGFLGSTAEEFANENSIEFIDVETIHTHEYVHTDKRGFCSYETCWCSKVKSSLHTDSDYNAICDVCSKSTNDIEINETIFSTDTTGCLSFTATADGTYTFQVFFTHNGYIYVYNEDKTEILASQEYKDMSHTPDYISFYMKKGQKVYWCFSYTYENLGSPLRITLSYQEHSHSYTPMVITAGTCETDGEILYTCLCGDNYTETKTASGHTFGSWYISVYSSCTNGFEIKRDCKNCDHYETITLSSPGEHLWKEWYIHKEATCMTDGENRRYCSVCGTYETSTITAPGKHKQETTIIKATDTNDGKIIESCNICTKKISSKTIYKIASVKLSETKYTYNGKTKTPSVTIQDSKGNMLKKDVDYTVSYPSSRKNIGKYTITVKFKGNYGGTDKLSFSIVPSIISSVLSADVSTTSVKLSWAKVPGATNYRIYKYNTSAKKYESFAFISSKTTCTISGLKTATTYKFKIRAYTELEDASFLCGALSSEIKATTKPATPTLKVTSTSKGKATLTWKNVTGESGYQIYYSTKKDSGFKKYSSPKADTTKATVSKLTSGKTYYFRVRAYIKTDSGTVYGSYKTVSVKVK